MLRSRPREFDVPFAMYWRKISRGRTPTVISAPMLRMSGSDRVAALERVGRRDRLPFLPEAAIQPADDLALAEQDDEPLLDVARQPREVVHLEQLVRGQARRTACGIARGSWIASSTRLRMNRGAVRGVRRLADRLRHRRMRVDRADQLLDRALEPERQRRFGDELGRARADHVDAEDLVVLLVGDDLDEAFGLAGDPRAAEHAELERADLDVVAALLRLRFSVSPTLPISGSQ